MSGQGLSVTDQRTGKTYEIPIEHGAIRATSLRQIKVDPGEGRLMGFGHRVYKNYDPRARVIKQLADEVFAVTRPSPLLAVALELERIALEDEYFIARRLYPNVDFYSGLIYRAMGFPEAMFRSSSLSRGRRGGWPSGSR